MFLREVLAISVIREGGHAFKDAAKQPLTKQDATTVEVDATLKALGKRIGGAESSVENVPIRSPAVKCYNLLKKIHTWTKQ